MFPSSLGSTAGVGPANVLVVNGIKQWHEKRENSVIANSPIKDALNAKLRNSNISPYVKLVSGMAGGVAEACSLQPLDVAKTRLQLDKKGQYKGMFDCLKTIAKT